MEQDFYEKREYQRETVAIPFIYSADEGQNLSEGEWHEAVTVDIGPVLVGGIGFETEDDLNEGQSVRVALFMNLKLKGVWEREGGNFPIIYNAKVLRVSPLNGRRRIALIFGGLIGAGSAS
jgi:hypothetical protein